MANYTETTNKKLRLVIRGETDWNSGADSWLSTQNWNFQEIAAILNIITLYGYKHGWLMAKTGDHAISVGSGVIDIDGTYCYSDGVAGLPIAITGIADTAVYTSIAYPDYYYVYARIPSSGVELTSGAFYETLASVATTTQIWILNTVPIFDTTRGDFYLSDGAGVIHPKYKCRLIGILKTDTAGNLSVVSTDNPFRLDSTISDAYLLKWRSLGTTEGFIEGAAEGATWSLATGGMGSALTAPAYNSLWGWDDTYGLIVPMIVSRGLYYRTNLDQIGSEAAPSVAVVNVDNANYTITTADAGKSIRAKNTDDYKVLTLPASLTSSNDGLTYTVAKTGVGRVAIDCTGNALFYGGNRKSDVLYNDTPSEIGASVTLQYMAVNGMPVLDGANAAFTTAGSLVTNGGFDSTTTDWIGLSGTLANTTGSGGKTGEGLEITRTGASIQVAYQAFTGFVVGKLYQLSVYVKSGSSGDESFKIGASPTDITTFPEGIVQTGTSSTTWTNYRLVFEAISAVIYLAVAKNSTTAGTMLFDSVTLYELTEKWLVESINGSWYTE